MCTFWNAGVAASFLFLHLPSLVEGVVELDQMSNKPCLLACLALYVTDQSSHDLPSFFLCLWQKHTKPGLFLSTKIFFFSAYLMVFPQALQTRCSVLYQNRRQFNSFIASPSPNTHSLPYLADLHIVSSWEVNVTSWVSVRKNTNEYDQSYELPQNCFSMLTIGLQ